MNPVQAAVNAANKGAAGQPAAPRTLTNGTTIRR
jgi:hypothetical protein